MMRPRGEALHCCAHARGFRDGAELRLPVQLGSGGGVRVATEGCITHGGGGAAQQHESDNDCFHESTVVVRFEDSEWPATGAWSHSYIGVTYGYGRLWPDRGPIHP